MTATPALSPDIFGKYQKKISDDLYLDRKESEGVLIELKAFAAELINIYNNRDLSVDLFCYAPFTTNTDPGDEHESASTS